MGRSTTTKGAQPRDSHARTKRALTAINPALRLKVSQRARRMALRLDPVSRVVHLIVPPRASMERAIDFARENRLWIQKRMEDLPDPVPFVDGAVLPIMGRNVTIQINYDKTLRTTDIELKTRILSVHTNREDPSARIRRFLRQYAVEAIEDVARVKAKRLGRTFKTISVRDTRSRWGSCSNDGRLSFSWRLIFAPPMAMDYVVAHEVAHLKVMDHSKRFWDLCEKLSDDFDGGYVWMQKRGHELMRFGQDS